MPASIDLRSAELPLHIVSGDDISAELTFTDVAGDPVAIGASWTSEIVDASDGSVLASFTPSVVDNVLTLTMADSVSDFTPARVMRWFAKDETNDRTYVSGPATANNSPGSYGFNGSSSATVVSSANAVTVTVIGGAGSGSGGDSNIDGGDADTVYFVLNIDGGSA